MNTAAMLRLPAGAPGRQALALSPRSTLSHAASPAPSPSAAPSPAPSPAPSLSPSPAWPSNTAAQPCLTPHRIGRAAVLALHDELALAPKPGLVTPLDAGSHSDMDAHTFMRSLFALRHYFVAIAEAGQAGASFSVLQRLGMAAEGRMLVATGGVNTHRGAVFMLGLLCAAAGAAAAPTGAAPSPARLRQALHKNWGAALQQRCQRAPTLPGGITAQRLGLRGAAQEAAAGFPVLFNIAVPALANGLARGLTPPQARLDTLFHVMAVLDDCNLARRGGLAGLRHAQASARRFLDQGGTARAGGLAAAQAIARDFVARRLSPGGAADTLAAACWVQRLNAGPQGHIAPSPHPAGARSPRAAPAATGL